jgi:hypothetical protein
MLHLGRTIGTLLLVASLLWPVRGGAIAWGDPLCLLVRFHPGKPLILGNDCIHGFVPNVSKHESLS